MKKLFSFLAIIGILLSSNCTRIAENNDPVIGIWTHIFANESTTKKQTVKQEWIFNDAYLGRYHTYNNEQLTIISDFNWIRKDSVYIISYPGLKKEEDVVIMTTSEDEVILADHKGNILAKRE